MKRLIYQVYTGKKSKLYDHCTKSVAEYAKRIGADHIVQRTPILMIKPDPFQTNRSKESYEKYGGFLPIYEKENAFSYLKSYDQIAIIDADIYVRPDCEDCLFTTVGTAVDFAGVIERTMPITPAYTQKLANYTRMQYAHPGLNQLFNWKHPAGANFYNMGMMVINNRLKDTSMAKPLNSFFDVLNSNHSLMVWVHGSGRQIKLFLTSGLKKKI